MHDDIVIILLLSVFTAFSLVFPFSHSVHTYRTFIFGARENLKTMENNRRQFFGQKTAKNNGEKKGKKENEVNEVQRERE